MSYGASVLSTPPPVTVLRSFGVDASPQLLFGGQGTSWAVGGLVFKPTSDPAYEWLAQVLVDLVLDGVRLATPVPSGDGSWVCEGWGATRWVEGNQPDRAKASTWVQIVEAGRAFHRAVAHLHRPDVLDTRQGWWAVADRVAWGERAVDFCSEFADVSRRLQAALMPLGSSQLVHGDLTGNVLFAAGSAPAVIDISPYWRPPEYAEGVVVADALCWHGAQRSLLDLVGVSTAAVARALMFRMATTNERVASGVGGIDLQDEARRYRTATSAIGL